MSDSENENISKQGFIITLETIAKGFIRVKTKIWFDNLDIDQGVTKAVELYQKTLTDMRSKGFVIDGDIK